MSERFWLNLQTRYDLDVEKARLKGRLANEVAILHRRRRPEAMVRERG